MEIKENKYTTRGFNSKTGQISDLEKDGVIDSALIALNACKNAIGIASTILTANACLTLPPKEPQPFQLPMMPTM